MQDQWQKFLNTQSTTVEDDFNLLNNTDTLVDLSDLSLLSISGDDAQKLLQGQLTCDLTDTHTGHSRLGAHCNPQGRVLSCFRSFYYQDSYYLQLPATSLPIALTALQKYAVFFKTKLTTNDSLIRIGYSGPTASAHLLQIFNQLPENIDDTVQTQQAFIIQLPSTVPRYEILGEYTFMTTLWQTLANQTQIVSSKTWKLFDIAAGIAQIYPTTSGKFLPHELNLQLINAISFNKGCYTGQEIIARMHYRGKLKKHLYRARVHSHTPPLLGGDLYNKNQVRGTIVDYCQENHSHFQLLVIADEADLSSQPLFIDIANQLPLEFLTLPYQLEYTG